MNEFKQVHELQENQDGELVLTRNGKNCICPFAGQQVLPLPGNLNQITLQNFVKSCASSCPLLVIYPNKDEPTLSTVELRCTASEVHIPSVEIIPFTKPSNLKLS